MWRWINKWYKRNRVSLAILLGASLGIGLIIAAVCFFSPAALVAFSTLTIWGAAPLSFITAMYLPLALLTLATLMSAVAFGVITAGVLVIQQLTTIGQHLWALYREEKQPHVNPLIGGTYNYLHAHLRDANSYKEEYDEEYNEISSSSSHEEKQESSTCSSVFTEPDNHAESIPYTFTP